MANKKQLYLYDLPKGAKLTDCEVSDGSKYVVFDHIDGMYSYCVSEKGAVVHLAAMTPMRKVGDNEYHIDAAAVKRIKKQNNENLQLQKPNNKKR